MKSQAEAEAIAQALLDKLANGYIAAEGVASGNPRIKAGTMVQVSGVGEKFSGTLPRRDRDARPPRRRHATRRTFANSPSHTILGAVDGSNANGGAELRLQLVLGIVTNNNDPENMGRVRVMIPALADPQDAEGAWARIATPSAGKERGLLMLPVVGEEVLIGFEHDDTTRPVRPRLAVQRQGHARRRPASGARTGSFALRSDKKIYVESKEDFTIKSGAS